MYYIYCIHNLINNKVYVGKGKSRKHSRFHEHTIVANGGSDKYPTLYSLIHKAMNKYGLQNFSYTVFQRFTSEIDALEAEKYWITYFKSNVNVYGNKYGYNLTAGGDGVSTRVVSDATKSKISTSLKGRPLSKRCLSALKDWHKNNPTPLNRRCKISWVSDAELLDMVFEFGFCDVGEKFGVSGNAVRGRIKRRGLLSKELEDRCLKIKSSKIKKKCAERNYIPVV
jgi:group I intron endonuclease